MWPVHNLTSMGAKLPNPGWTGLDDRTVLRPHDPPNASPTSSSRADFQFNITSINCPPSKFLFDENRDSCYSETLAIISDLTLLDYRHLSPDNRRFITPFSIPSLGRPKPDGQARGKGNKKNTTRRIHRRCFILDHHLIQLLQTKTLRRFPMTTDRTLHIRLVDASRIKHTIRST